MKRWNTFFLIAILAFAWACSPYPHESERMATALREAMALYGDEGVLPDDTVVFIPDLDRASAYYAGKKQYGTAALAALYHGYAEEDYNKSVAMEAYKEAEHYGTVAGDSLTVARAQYRMGRMLIFDINGQEALAILKKAELNFGSRLHERALTLNSMACCHMLLSQYDSAELLLDQSLELADQMNDEEIRNKVLNNYAVMYLRLNRYDEALQHILLARKPNDPKTRTIYYLNMGKTYMAMDMVDSASFYYQLLENSLSDSIVSDATKVAAYFNLSYFAESQGDFANALRLRKSYDNLQHQVQQGIERKNYYRIQQQYDHEVLENEIQSERMRNQRALIFIVLMLLLLLVLLVITILRRAQFHRQQEELSQELCKIKKDLERSIAPNVVDEEIMWRLQLILKAQKLKSNSNSNSNRAKQESIEKHIMGKQENGFEAAKTAIETIYPGLYSALQNKFPELNETDLRVCLLSCADLTNGEIADLLELSIYSINKSRSNIYKKIGIESKNLDSGLFSNISSLLS